MFCYFNFREDLTFLIATTQVKTQLLKKKKHKSFIFRRF